MKIFPSLFALLCGVSTLVLSCEDGHRALIRGTKCLAYSECRQGTLFANYCQPGRHFDNDTISCKKSTKCYDYKSKCIQNISYLHPKYCRAYYLCINGRLSLAFCPVGEAYNQQSNSCEPNINCVKLEEKLFIQQKQPASPTALSTPPLERQQRENELRNQNTLSKRNVPKFEKRIKHRCKSPCREYHVGYQQCLLKVDYPINIPKPSPTSSINSTTIHFDSPSDPPPPSYSSSVPLTLIPSDSPLPSPTSSDSPLQSLTSSVSSITVPSDYSRPSSTSSFSSITVPSDYSQPSSTPSVPPITVPSDYSQPSSTSSFSSITVPSDYSQPSSTSSFSSITVPSDYSQPSSTSSVSSITVPSDYSQPSSTSSFSSITVPSDYSQPSSTSSVSSTTSPSHPSQLSTSTLYPSLPSPSPSPACTEGEKIPISGDCSSFLRCIDGSLVQNECEWYRRFDVQTKECKLFGVDCA